MHGPLTSMVGLKRRRRRPASGLSRPALLRVALL